MACDCCQKARECQSLGGQYLQFSPSCLWCGARLIQAIGRLRIDPDSSVSRRRAVLADWMAMGHPEQELRRLAKEKALPLEPIGQAVSGASEPQTPTKRRFPSRK